jgi:hypothetical protein
MKKIIAAIIFIMFFAFAPAVAASTDDDDRTGNWNFNETTGLINIPNARTIEYRKAEFSIRLAKIAKHAPYKKKEDAPGGGPATGSIFDSDWWFWNDGDRRVLFSPAPNFEINLMNIRSNKTTPIIGLKFVAIPETDHFPAIAAGIHNANMFEEDAGTSELRWINSKAAPFVVATKSFFKGGAVELTAGFGGGRFRRRVFYGGEVFMDARHRLSAMGEYDGNISSYGLKYRMPGSRWEFGAVLQDGRHPGATFSYKMPW